MVSMEFIASVSATLVHGTSVKGSFYSYYYSKSFTYNTYPPSGIVAILKNAGTQVAKLNGVIVSHSWNGTCYNVCISFQDVSFNCYTFTCICIYTCALNTLYVLVTKITGLNCTKNKQYVLCITYELGVTPNNVDFNIFWIAFSFAWIICGTNNVFNFSEYYGITRFALCNLNGEIQIVSIDICPTGVVFYAKINTNGTAPNPNQPSYIVAYTTVPPRKVGTSAQTTPVQCVVFKIPITSSLSTSSSMVKFGVRYL